MSAIAVELFDRVDEFAEGVNKSPKKFWKDKSSNEAIGVFCENFFGQFFASLGMQITGFGVKAKEAAVRKRLSLQKRKSFQPARQLIAEYEDLCEIWDDIQGARYIENRQAMADFACTFLPALLEDAIEWLATLTSQDDRRALARARESEKKYQELVKPTCP
jgi:hypothetical protein